MSTPPDINIVRQKIDRPIVLVGMMAAGKSRLGRELSKTLKLPFFDTDKRIEEEADRTIAGIFEAEGEQGFRDREARMIAHDLSGQPGARVVSTGGGAILRPESADLIFGKTISIWLRASVETIIERTSRRTDRPLLKNVDQAKVLREMAERRYPIYERATFAIDTDHGDSGITLDAILQKLNSL
ncbi:MAG: shikimate kinase family protein [Micavibrio sp.]|nr:shikimate kinase family protein [Micavibrio sp.]